VREHLRIIHEIGFSMAGGGMGMHRKTDFDRAAAAFSLVKQNL